MYMFIHVHVLVFADDHSRVVLTSEANVAGSDYINASSIVRHCSRHYY